ncbi:MAG: arsenate reductase ArsC [Gammaproteobacteria bacterium]
MTESLSYNVLFLCTGNSARSILAEALLNHHGRERFKAYSAGSHPTGTVNPLTLRVLEEAHLPTVGLRSKSWDEFTAADASPIDFVITVCDKAAAEPCPVWSGHPAMAHWGIADPAAVEGDEDKRLHAFREALRSMDQRVRLFLSLPIERLAQRQLHEALQRIGRGSGA